MAGPVIPRHPIADPQGQVTRPWLLYFNQIAGGGSVGSGPIIITHVFPGIPNGFVLTDSATITWDFSTPGVAIGNVNPIGLATLGSWQLLTNGDPLNPEVIFDGDGDVIAMFVPA